MSQKQKLQNNKKAIYTTEYRTQAVQLALGAVSIAQAARDLGISEKTLHGWVAAQKNASATGTTVEANRPLPDTPNPRECDNKIPLSKRRGALYSYVP